jgi:hypothetical protein
MNQLENEPITHAALILLGYSRHVGGYYCSPFTKHSHYQLEFAATQFKNGPVKGTEKWRAYLTDTNLCTIRRFETLGELNYFHKGMGGEYLFQIEQKHGV